MTSKSSASDNCIYHSIPHLSSTWSLESQPAQSKHNDATANLLPFLDLRHLSILIHIFVMAFLDVNFVRIQTNCAGIWASKEGTGIISSSLQVSEETENLPLFNATVSIKMC